MKENFDLITIFNIALSFLLFFDDHHYFPYPFSMDFISTYKFFTLVINFSEAFKKKAIIFHLNLNFIFNV